MSQIWRKGEKEEKARDYTEKSNFRYTERSAEVKDFNTVPELLISTVTLQREKEGKNSNTFF